MERGSGAVISDIGDHIAFGCERIKACKIGALMNETALEKNAEKIGFR
jgi:hypothetical protein